jgi:hypothetical protein
MSTSAFGRAPEGVAEGGGSGGGRKGSPMKLGDGSGGMPEIGVRFDKREVQRWPLAQASD